MRDVGITADNVIFARHILKGQEVVGTPDSLRRSTESIDSLPLDAADDDENMMTRQDDAQMQMLMASRGREQHGDSYTKIQLASRFSGNRATAGASGTVMGVSERLRQKLRESWSRVSQLLQEWDSDGDGEISKEEFTKGMVAMGIALSKYEVEEVFAVYDKDGGGSIDFFELNRFLRSGHDQQLDTKMYTRRSPEQASHARRHATPAGGGRPRPTRRQKEGAAG